MDILFLAGRVLYGGFFIMMAMNHFIKLDDLTGYAQSKNVPAARAMVLFTGLMMLAGGLGIFFGVYPVFAVALIVIFLAVTNFKMHAFWSLTDMNARMIEKTQFMKNTALGGAALMMLAIPEPWIFSLLG